MTCAHDPAMPHRPLTVLYIDDDVALGRLVQRILARKGYAVEHVGDAEAGLARIAQGGIDAVILDHDLGTSSGLEVLARLAGSEGAPPVVYVTASSELAIAVQALKAGAVDYVVKTIGEDFEVLLTAALEQSVERARLLRAKEEAEREVRDARDRAIVLLAEVNHRVANSLALVSSLVRMQAASVQDAGARAALAETQARITAIAGMHRSLYTSEDVSRVELNKYLGRLTAELSNSLSSAEKPMRVLLDIDHISLSADKAVSVGMIVTELVTNAHKYAYPPGEGGDIRVHLKRIAEDEALLRVEDDGIGIDPDSAPKGTGLGSRIVKSMAATLGDGLRYLEGQTGTVAEVPLKLDVIS